MNEIQATREILGGTPVFRGTRVPFRGLIDYLEAGESIDDFVRDYPSVTREQAVHTLSEIGHIIEGLVSVSISG